VQRPGDGVERPLPLSQLLVAELPPRPASKRRLFGPAVRKGLDYQHGGIKTAGAAAKSLGGRITSMISFHNLGPSFDRGVRNFVPVHGERGIILNSLGMLF
jgi:hypothetical protein